MQKFNNDFNLLVTGDQTEDALKFVKRNVRNFKQNKKNAFFMKNS